MNEELKKYKEEKKQSIKDDIKYYEGKIKKLMIKWNKKQFCLNIKGIRG